MDLHHWMMSITDAIRIQIIESQQFLWTDGEEHQKPF